MKLLLFDIDGTLVLTGGAGLRGMTRAIETVFGVPDALRGVPVSGRTDPAILLDALGRAGVRPADGDVARFPDVYVPMLAEEIGRPAPAEKHPSQHSLFKGTLAGVVPLVDALRGHDGVFLALLTGNYRRGAEVKLGHFDLWRHFTCGAFGDDAQLRHELVPIAVSRARAAGCPDVAPADVIVIGDTPLDVDCARRAGVKALAVATGGHGAEALREAGADWVVDSLEDTPALVRILSGGSS